MRAHDALPGLLFLTIHHVAHCIQCFACSSQFTKLEVELKLQLQRQSVFFPPPSGFDPACHLPPVDTPNPSASICVTPTCVTLTPHVPGVNFTLRGCGESILKHAFRSREDLSPGCRVVEGRDAFGASFPHPLRLILCTCDADWCNGQQQPTWPERMAADSSSLQTPSSGATATGLALALLLPVLLL